MKRRVSSRDDLFLSALDMYTLLSLVLIGFAFVVSRVGARDEHLLELPTFDGKTTAKKASEILTVRWAGKNECRAGEGRDKRCSIRYTLPDRASGSASRMGDDNLLRVPCCPAAFYSGVTLPEETDLVTLHDLMQEEYPEVAIACAVSDPEGCFNLQWVMASGHFQIRAVTVDRKESEPQQ